MMIFSAFHFLNFFLILFSFLNLCKNCRNQWTVYDRSLNRSLPLYSPECQHLARRENERDIDRASRGIRKFWRIINWAKPVCCWLPRLATGHMEPSGAAMHLELARSTPEIKRDLRSLSNWMFIFLLLTLPFERISILRILWIGALMIGPVQILIKPYAV